MKLIEKFENHQHKESFLQDLSQTQKINKFSKESQDLIADMNNTEIFELCENSSKQQCLECNIYWEIGIIYCRCGRKMKSSQRTIEFAQNNRDVTQSLAMLSRRTAVVGPNMDLLKDKESTTHSNRCSKRHVGKSTETTQRYFHDGTPANRTETRCQKSGGKKKTQCHTIEFPWRSMSTSQQKQRELKIRSIGFSR